MNNSNWVCFDCRTAVRRQDAFAGDVPCPQCGKSCQYLGDKIPLPRKTNEAEWERLYNSIIGWCHAQVDRAKKAKSRRIHELEKRIAEFRSRPANKNPDGLIAELVKAIDSLRREK